MKVSLPARLLVAATGAIAASLNVLGSTPGNDVAGRHLVAAPPRTTEVADVESDTSADWPPNSCDWRQRLVEVLRDEELATLPSAMVAGIRDYDRRCGHPDPPQRQCRAWLLLSIDEPVVAWALDEAAWRDAHELWVFASEEGMATGLRPEFWSALAASTHRIGQALENADEVELAAALKGRDALTVELAELSERCNEVG